MSESEDRLPPYVRDTGLPAYTPPRQPDPVTLAMYLFKFGFCTRFAFDTKVYKTYSKLSSSISTSVDSGFHYFVGANPPSLLFTTFEGSGEA
jgi:hypothetical protein